MVEIIIPEMGESITEAIISQLYKNKGEHVDSGDAIAELETDKVTIELSAPASGILSNILVSVNDTVQIGQKVGEIDKHTDLKNKKLKPISNLKEEVANISIFDVLIPQMGESITEAIISQLYKKDGDSVEEGDPIGELETDKVTLELSAPATGVISNLSISVGNTVEIGKKVAEVLESSTLAVEQKPTFQIIENNESINNMKLPPSVQILIDDNNLDISKIHGTGKRNQILKRDVIEYLKDFSDKPAEEAISNVKLPKKIIPEKITPENRKEVVTPMSPLRKSIANRLVSVQRDAAILTTFNEIDMTPLIELRNQYRDSFAKKYNVKLGFMGFFTKAVLHALEEVPSVNAEIQGDNIIYKKYYHIGIAVGGPRGLVVPVLRDANQLTISDIEKEIGLLVTKIQESSIGLADLSGGTFTITNGGIYGSMLSTPILNPPQSGILGMHNIVKRPVVINDEIVIRSIMYVALSYDHRLIDGKEAVTFLKIIKEQIEDPTRLFLGV